jgi:histidyl-tRNA synthetase
LALIEELRWGGLVVDYSLTPAKPDKQHKRAQELNARHTVRLQREENGEVLAAVRNLSQRTETRVACSAVLATLNGNNAPPG